MAVFPFRFMPIQLGQLELNALRLVSDQIEAGTARDFVIAPGLAETEFFQSFVKFMDAHDRGWDVISLPGVLENSSAAAALKSSPALPYVHTKGGARGRVEAITCGEGDRPFARLSKGFRQNLRTAHNKLKTNRVSFEIADTERHLLALLPEFLKVESSGWKGELGTSAAKDPQTGSFLRGLISHLGANGGCEIHIMRVDDAPVAALFGVVTDNVWYIFRIGYDEAFHRASPGHLIIENLLKQSAERKNFTVVTPYNAPPWFQSWRPASMLQIRNAYVFRPSPNGHELANRAATILRELHGQPG